MKNLTAQQKKILERLSRSGLAEFFYLTGGTALSLRYQHRLSEDLDLFTFPAFAEKNFPLEKTTSALRKSGGKITGIEKGIVWGLVENIKVSFFSYPYPLLKPTSTICGFPAASDEDIAASKPVSIAQRGEKKDFFDLWFLCQKHAWDLPVLLELSRQKYGLSPEQKNFFLRSLVYFEDAEPQAVFLEEGQALEEKKVGRNQKILPKTCKKTLRKPLNPESLKRKPHQAPAKERSKRSSMAFFPASVRYLVPVPTKVSWTIFGVSSSHFPSRQVNHFSCFWSKT